MCRVNLDFGPPATRAGVSWVLGGVCWVWGWWRKPLWGEKAVPQTQERRNHTYIWLNKLMEAKCNSSHDPSVVVVVIVVVLIEEDDTRSLLCVDFYSAVRHKWVNQAEKLRNVTVLSVGGGYRDYQVRSGLTSLPCTPRDPNKLSLVVSSAGEFCLGATRRNLSKNPGKFSTRSFTNKKYIILGRLWSAGLSSNQGVGGSIPALVDVSLNPELLP